MTNNFKKVKIHLKTYIRFAKAYGEVTAKDVYTRPIVYAFSDYDGRILAYSPEVAKRKIINPGAWFLFGGIGVPFYRCDGRYKGIFSHGEKEIDCNTASKETPLGDLTDSVLFEIEIVPDDVSEDVSGMRV